MTSLIRGLWPAMLTPLTADGAVDVPLLVAHGRRMLAAGCDGFTLFGTTGEGPSFSVAERKQTLEAVLAAGISAERLIVCTMASALPDAVELTRHAVSRGCAGVLLLPPFYFDTPTDAGVIKATSHVIRAAADPRLRVILYHIPQLTRVSYSHAAIAELKRRHPEAIVGIKDSSGNLEHAMGLVPAFPELGVMVGCEPHLPPVLQAGGVGSICGLANLAPRLMERVIHRPHQITEADRRLIDRLLALIGRRDIVPVFKTILAEQTGEAGWLRTRVPMMPLDAADVQDVLTGYRAIGVRADQL